LKFYADVHRNRRSGEASRITYTVDGKGFKHAEGFGEIPAGPGDKLFMDTIPPNHTDGAIELLRGEWRSIISEGLYCSISYAENSGCRRLPGEI
jgi:hypothetical protein